MNHEKIIQALNGAPTGCAAGVDYRNKHEIWSFEVVPGQNLEAGHYCFVMLKDHDGRPSDIAELIKPLQRVPENHENIIAQHLKPGDTITHTRCMGCVQEHIYTGKDGHWLCGIPTADTMRIEQWDGEPADHATNDISPRNVTHINRTPVESIPLLAEVRRSQA